MIYIWKYIAMHWRSMESVMTVMNEIILKDEIWDLDLVYNVHQICNVHCTWWTFYCILSCYALGWYQKVYIYIFEPEVCLVFKQTDVSQHLCTRQDWIRKKYVQICEWNSFLESEHDIMVLFIIHSIRMDQWFKALFWIINHLIFFETYNIIFVMLPFLHIKSINQLQIYFSMNPF